MAANRPRHVARTRRCDVLEDAGLAQRDETSAVMRCCRELLREPAFASALVLLISGNGQDAERKDTRDFASEASVDNGKG
jgi:hypothetical protein